MKHLETALRMLAAGRLRAAESAFREQWHEHPGFVPGMGIVLAIARRGRLDAARAAAADASKVAPLWDARLLKLATGEIELPAVLAGAAGPPMLHQAYAYHAFRLSCQGRFAESEAWRKLARGPYLPPFESTWIAAPWVRSPTPSTGQAHADWLTQHSLCVADKADAIALARQAVQLAQRFPCSLAIQAEAHNTLGCHLLAVDPDASCTAHAAAVKALETSLGAHDPVVGGQRLRLAQAQCEANRLAACLGTLKQIPHPAALPVHEISLFHGLRLRALHALGSPASIAAGRCHLDIETNPRLRYEGARVLAEALERNGDIEEARDVLAAERMHVDGDPVASAACSVALARLAGLRGDEAAAQALIAEVAQRGQGEQGTKDAVEACQVAAHLRPLDARGARMLVASLLPGKTKSERALLLEEISRCELLYDESDRGGHAVSEAIAIVKAMRPCPELQLVRLQELERETRTAVRHDAGQSLPAMSNRLRKKLARGA